MREKVALRETFRTPYFLLKTSSSESGHNRFGIIVSNAAVKKSVRRHLWKRRFAHHIRLWPNIRKDILVIVSPNIENVSTKDLKKELDKMLQKLLITNF
ncbi:MAG: ribonuclease P protein component [Candidatus Liptonbacteria bacterium]|nr:ribonuclease P protein component [Candidatus Liptonbacteria bacterium]